MAPGANINPTFMASGAATASGNTSLIAGTAGIVYTLVGIQIETTGNVASVANGTITVDLFDGASTALNLKSVFFAPITAPTAGTTNALTSGWMLVPYAAARITAGNALNINLSAALTAGTVQVTVAYMKEPA